MRELGLAGRPDTAHEPALDLLLPADGLDGSDQLVPVVQPYQYLPLRPLILHLTALYELLGPEEPLAVMAAVAALVHQHLAPGALHAYAVGVRALPVPLYLLRHLHLVLALELAALYDVYGGVRRDERYQVRGLLGDQLPLYLDYVLRPHLLARHVQHDGDAVGVVLAYLQQPHHLGRAAGLDVVHDRSYLDVVDLHAFTSKGPTRAPPASPVCRSAPARNTWPASSGLWPALSRSAWGEDGG